MPAQPERPATQAWWSLTAASSDEPVSPAAPWAAASREDAGPADPASGPLLVPGLWDERPTAPAPVVSDAAPQTARAHRRPRAARPGALPPARAVAGAAVAVAGVALGIGTLLWATEAPGGDPALRAPAAQEQTGAEPAVALPEAEERPVDPAPPPAPVVQAPAPPVEAPAPAPPPAPPPPPPAPAAPAFTPVPVLVLNNSRIDGLAERAAAYFEREGWPVRDIGSSGGRIRATTIYYPAGQEAVAQEFARRFPGIERVLPRLENLPGTGLTVVVTRDFDV